MKQYYLYKLVYKDNAITTIWYSNDIAGFLTENNGLLVFTDSQEAETYAKVHGIQLEAESSELDLSDIPKLLNSIELNESCSVLINIWFAASDLSKSLSVDFLGDTDEDLVLDVYYKLFYGMNIRALKAIEYHPTFDDEEWATCIAVLNDGLTLLNNQIEGFQVDLFEL